MADPLQAVTLTLRNEDSTLAGTITYDAGGKTRYGIAEVDNPDLWDAAHPDGPTLAEAQARLISQYWPHAFSALSSQHVADFVFDLAVNVGQVHAAKIFQRAISSLGPTVVIDGVIGALTVQAANQCDEDKLIAAIKSAAQLYYRQIVEDKPEDAKDLLGWMNRVSRDAAVPAEPQPLYPTETAE